MSWIFRSHVFDSPEVEDEDNLPAVKKKKANLAEWLTKKSDAPAGANNTQARKVSKSMKPASPKAKEKKAAAIKKRIVESDDEDLDFDDLPKPPARKGAPGRSAASKSKYIELSSSDEGGDDAMFVDDD
jgi:DNA topoisomerase-2